VTDRFDCLTARLSGRQLIESSAGTGKTWNIASLYVRLLLERSGGASPLQVPEILVVTFTRAATEELKGRIRGRIRSLLLALRREERARGGSQGDRDVLDALARRDPFLHGMAVRSADPGKDGGLLLSALRTFDEAAIFTIHSFCGRVLKENAFESASLFDTELVKEEDDLRYSVAADFYRKTVHGTLPRDAVRALVDEGFHPERLSSFLKENQGKPFLDLLPVREAREEGAPPKDRVNELRHDLLDYGEAEMARRKARRNIRFQDDLLRDLYRALVRGGGSSSPLARTVRSTFRAALIDEFQDTDLLQYGIFSALFPEGSTLFLIGDPKQAIYGFRGADIHAYLAAKETVPGEGSHSLGKNFRSVPLLVEAVNLLFDGEGAPSPFGSVPFQRMEADRSDAGLVVEGEADPAPLRIWWREAPPGGKATRAGGVAKETMAADVARAVASDVVSLLSASREGKATIPVGKGGTARRAVEPGDVAILVRTNRQARLVQRELRLRRVPAVIYGDASVFASADAVELLRLLWAVADPGNDGLVRAALATTLLGADGAALARLREEEGEWGARLLDFFRWRDLWVREGFTAMVRTVMDEREVRARLLVLPDGERKLTNLLHMVELLHRAAHEERLGVEGVAGWLSRRIADAGEGGTPAEEHQLRLESDEAAVKVITIHRSKGLEFPVVYCPFLWHVRSERKRKDPPAWEERGVLCHEPGPPPRMVRDFGSDRLAAHEARRKEEERDEEARLLYVALTRAMCRLTVAWGYVSEGGSSALGRLLHPGAPWKGYSEEAVAKDLGALASRSGGSVDALPLPAPSLRRYEPPAAETVSPAPRTFPGTVERSFHPASFSSLVFGAKEHGGADRDEAPPALPPLPGRAAAGAEKGATGPFDFPRGPRTGNFFHEVMEFVPFDADRDRIAAEVRQRAPGRGIGREWEEGAVSLVWNALHTPLGAPRAGGAAVGPLRLVGKADRVHEMEFAFPLKAVTAEALAGVFAAHRLAAPADFAALLRALSFGTVRGMMKGYVDLLFRAGEPGREKYYLLDWKTNHLGWDIEEYGEAGLLASVSRDYYFLQYHLYTVALDRWLSLRLGEGYDYGTHFGGVFYLYVRGMDPARGSGFGIHRAFPDRALVKGLSARLFAEGAP
jgi:exodeoxyribonuclease V beta subunit